MAVRTRLSGARWFQPFSLALLCLTLVGAGCGEQEEEGTTTEPVVEAPSRAEFLREADRICLGAEAQIEAAADELALEPGRPDPAAVKRVALRVAVPALEAEVAAVGALTPPAGDEARIEAILAATRRGIAQIEADPAALADGVPAALREAQRLAQRYGSQQCGIR